MPYSRRRYRKPSSRMRNKYRRRRYRRRRRKRMTTKIVRMPSLIPDRLFVKFRTGYTDTMISTGMNPQLAYGNALADPTGTISTPQPRGYDQWRTFYAMYKVHAYKLEITFMNNSTTRAANVGYILSPDSSITVTGPRDIYEAPYSKCKVLSPLGSNNRAVLKVFMPIRKIQGDKSLGDDYESEMSNVPNKLSYIHFYGVDSLNHVSQAANLEYDFRIIMYTEMFQRILPPRSDL